MLSASETSPWLQLTRWPSYLNGHCLLDVAALVRQPDRTLEPVLLAVCDSLERVVEDAYQSVCNDAINVFDQVRINSFLHRPRAADRPLMVKLQKSTWRRYTRIWKALVCFTYRTTQPGQTVLLQHRLTNKQTACLHKVVMQGERLVQLSAEGKAIGDEVVAAVERVNDAMGRSCLELCISLLDHDLKGDLFESAAVGFLAALGIDPTKGILMEAYHFTPSLSGFIKIAQMLVIQKAVIGAREVEGAEPADLLDEMRARFLINGVRSPFSWASQLRVYGKKVRDSTTCLGYISWADDGLSVSYKGIPCLHMDAFRDFVRDQVYKVQGRLEQLLLLHPREKREDLGVEFSMHRIVDNPAENQRGWSFLCHPQNLQGALPNREKWLLERVLKTQWLREEFMCPESTAQHPVWNQKSCQDYLLKVDAYLERLLLLIHLTAGQPARGSEILSLRSVNTVNGHHRNVFVEGGMVSTVTTYHKGYSTTGNTKIIHRYLPKEVGELLVYYLWLVQPFCRNLEMLALRRRDLPSPFLWAKPGSPNPWDGSRLSRILQQETKDAFGVAMNIPVYRHLAVAMSRKHLKCGGFKRDYGIEESVVDRQGSHTSWTAGTTYARGLEEAAGHVEARKLEYRKVSQEWHQFLGFVPSALPSRKRLFSDITN
jgi:hypothetical protein